MQLNQERLTEDSEKRKDTLIEESRLLNDEDSRNSQESVEQLEVVNRRFFFFNVEKVIKKLRELKKLSQLLIFQTSEFTHTHNVLNLCYLIVRSISL